MKRVLTAVVLIPLVLLVLFKAPLWLFTLVVGVIAMGAAHEFLDLLKHYKLQRLPFITPLIIAVLFCAAALVSAEPRASNGLWLGTIVFLIIACPAIYLVAAMRNQDLPAALPSAATELLSIPYIGLTLFCLPVIRGFNSGIFLIVFMFTVVWSGDIFAYYAGRAFGKHKLAPRISPGKTWEGTAASFIGSVLLAHIVFVDSQQIMDALSRWHLVSDAAGIAIPDRHIRLMHGVMLGALVNIAAQLGDLVESMMKRGAGVKDSGTLLPGHGGILDRIDALLFAAPVVAVYAIMFQFVGIY